ncbi:MAG: hypothetical protein R2932_04035 [Caldilineaceae bacterium]
MLVGQTGMILAFVMAIAMNMGAWWFSDKLALRMSNAREVTAAEMPELPQDGRHAGAAGTTAQTAGLPH